MRCGVYKTPHHPDYQLDGDAPMREVAAATSAAPTYFEPFQKEGYTYLDGGIWANNPTMAALVEALSCFDVRPENVRILSLGCGGKPFQMSAGQAKSAGLLHWLRVFEVQMHLQSTTAINEAGCSSGGTTSQDSTGPRGASRLSWTIGRRRVGYCHRRRKRSSTPMQPRLSRRFSPNRPHLSNHFHDQKEGGK